MFNFNLSSLLTNKYFWRSLGILSAVIAFVGGGSAVYARYQHIKKGYEDAQVRERENIAKISTLTSQLETNKALFEQARSYEIKQEALKELISNEIKEHYDSVLSRERRGKLPLNELAAKKPRSIERIVNSSTADAMECFEYITGDHNGSPPRNCPHRPVVK